MEENGLVKGYLLITGFEKKRNEVEIMPIMIDQLNRF